MNSIVLVEPDSVLSDIYAKALTSAGFTVVVARGAQSAVEAVETSQPASVVLEMGMLGHSGVEFLYELRSYPEWRTIPVVVHSFVPPERLQGTTLKHLGIDRVLYKPATSLTQLVETIKGAIKHIPPTAASA